MGEQHAKGVCFPFFEQTQISEEMFLATSIAMQQEVKLEKGIENVLVQKISNLVETGEDNISYKKAIEKLNKIQLEKIGTDRSRETLPGHRR